MTFNCGVSFPSSTKWESRSQTRLVSAALEGRINGMMRGRLFHALGFTNHKRRSSQGWCLTYP